MDEPTVLPPTPPQSSTPPQPLDSSVASAPPTQPTANQAPHEPANAGRMILQWLTYAFWGWTVLALSILTGLIVSSLLFNAEVGEFSPYAIAAVLVLLPVSFVCDFYYSKKEPPKKAGAEMAIMAIHAVIFALFGISSVILAVFSIVQIFISNTDTSGSISALITSIIISIYYAATFIRTLHPRGLSKISTIYRIFMTVTIVIIVILGFVGPVAQERTLRNDKLISSNLSLLKSSIDNYAADNGRLPNSLKDLSLSGDAQKLVDQNLVRYINEAGSASPTPTPSATSFQRNTIDRKGYRYQLCVTYTAKSGNYDESRRLNNNEYESYIYASSHPAGEVCYKLTTSPY